MNSETLGLFLAAAEACVKDISGCQAQILMDYYYLGLLTKPDAKNLDFLQSIVNGVEQWILPKAVKAGKRRLMQGLEGKVDGMKNRVLEFKWDIASGGFSSLWNEYSEAMGKMEFRINTGLAKTLGEADSQMVTDLSGLDLFKADKRCPLASTFKAKLHETNRDRQQKNLEKFGLCPNLKNTCCAESGFITMRDDWNIALLRLGTIHSTISKKI
jgi:hypothetical protein